jgi:predicted nuclease with TOPRIM domain
MPEDISVQLLTQTSENIQKLFELSTRIDERVKAIQGKQHDLEERLDSVVGNHTEIMQKIAVLESKNGEALEDDIDECRKELVTLDKRVAVVEDHSGNSRDRWNKVFTFVIQLVWVLLAAWLLVKLNLQAPAVP